MKFDRPDDDYYRREIGRKLERACLFDSDIEDPSPETVKMWMEKAKELREKRRRRKRLLISSAAVFVLSVGIGATIAFEQPSAEAGNSGEVRIETNMNSKNYYNSEEDIPEDTWDDFIKFPYITEGYEFEEGILETGENLKRLLLFYSNGTDEIYIEETAVEDEKIISQTVKANAKKEIWNTQEVYIESFTDGNGGTAVIYVKDKTLVSINTPIEIEKEEIQKIVENEE